MYVLNVLRIVDIVLKKLTVFSVTLDTTWNMISLDLSDNVWINAKKVGKETHGVC